MTIDKINSGNFTEKDLNKSKKSDKAHSADNSGKADNTSSAEAKKDRFSPSGTKMSSDFDLATAELEKLRDSSFGSLKEVKKKIQEGAYDKKEVHQKIGSLVEKDLKSVEQMLSKMPGTEEVDADKKSFSAEYQQYLIENPKVVEKVAQQVAADLQRL